MTQKELGEKIGVKLQQIHKYEVGENRIRASRMLDMAAALEVHEAFFFEGLEAYLNDRVRYAPISGPSPARRRTPAVGRRLDGAAIAAPASLGA